jgi:hypothetical protein
MLVMVVMMMMMMMMMIETMGTNIHYVTSSEP